jgi:hypothetical protein
MSLVSLEDVRARVATDLDDLELQQIIDAEEAELAERIGALTGEIEQTYAFDLADTVEAIYLARPATAGTLTIEDPTGTELAPADVRLTWGGQRVERAIGIFGGPVVARYTPADEHRVRRWVVELVRIATTDPTVDSETIGSYTYRRATITMGDLEAARERIYAQALARPRGLRGLGTIAIRSRTATAARLDDYAAWQA